MPETIRILIIAAHPAVRADMRTILQLADGIEVAGEAADLPETVRRAQELSPDVALVDLEMPCEAGFAILQELKSRRLARFVIALTAHEYPAARETAVRCGADAVIIKGADLNKMLEVIRKIA